VVLEDARLATCLGLRHPAAAIAPAMPQFLYQREADTKALCYLLIHDCDNVHSSLS